MNFSFDNFEEFAEWLAVKQKKEDDLKRENRALQNQLLLETKKKELYLAELERLQAKPKHPLQALWENAKK